MVLVDSSALNQGSWMGMPNDTAGFAAVVARSRACADAAERPAAEAGLAAALRGDGRSGARWAGRLAEISALAEPTAAERTADAAGSGRCRW
jgi:hypothetical protein